jgi:hypothetical protein
MFPSREKRGTPPLAVNRIWLFAKDRLGALMFPFGQCYVSWEMVIQASRNLSAHGARNMRLFFVGLALLAFSKPAFGEVVITNLGQSSSRGSDFGSGDWVQFNSTQVSGLNTLVILLRGFNPGETVNSVSATITASDAAIGSITRSAFLSQVGVTNYYEAAFDVGGLSLGSGTNRLAFTNVSAATSQGSVVYWGATNGEFTYTSGYSAASTSDDGVGAFGQFSVSVPEPGTLMLGLLLAAIGLVLWKCNCLVWRSPLAQ